MYGDCQVMSTMGGNVPSDTLFSSPIQNPNFNFMPFQSFSSIIPVSNLLFIFIFLFIFLPFSFGYNLTKNGKKK